jgi:hypothetical protein
MPQVPLVAHGEHHGALPLADGAVHYPVDNSFVA